MTSAYTQMHAHTNTNTLQSKLRVQIGWRGEAGGGWWRLKWKSRTDQYCWRFSSLHSPLNCHAHSKQLKARCLSTSTPVPFLFFHLSPPVFSGSLSRLFSNCLSLPLLSFTFSLGSVSVSPSMTFALVQLCADASRTRS